MLHAVCSVQTPKSETQRDEERFSIGKGGKAVEIWETSWSWGEGMRGGVK